MMKKIKIFAMIATLALAISAVFALFAGCSKNNEQPDEQKTLQFATSKIELEIGQTVQLVPAYPQNYADAEWISRNESVATVDGSGKVTALSIGTAIIKLTVSVGEQTQSALCQVTVAKKSSVAIGQVVVSDTDVTIFAGETYAVQAHLQFGNEKIADAEWSTSNANVCTVNNGVITGVAQGSAIVSASCTRDGIKYSADITVSVAAKQTIEFDLKDDYVVKDESVQLEVFLVKDGNVSKLDNDKVRYSVDDETVATISGNVLTGVKAGEIALTATVETELGKTSATIRLNVLRYCNVEYMVEGEVFATEQVLNTKCAILDVETPILNGYLFKEWTLGGETFTSDLIVNDDIEVDASWCKLTSDSGEYVNKTILRNYVDGTGFVHDGNGVNLPGDGSFRVYMQTSGKYDYSVTLPAFNFIRQGVTQFNIDVNHSGWAISIGNKKLSVTSSSAEHHYVFNFTVYATADGAKLVNGNVSVWLTDAQANGSEGITFTTTRPQGSPYAEFTISPMFLSVYDYRAMLSDKAAVLAEMTADSDKSEYFGYYVDYFDSFVSATPYEQENMAASVPSGIAHAKELLQGCKYTLIDFTSDTHGVSAKKSDGSTPFEISCNENGLKIDPSDIGGLYTVYLPKINYLLYKSISFTYSVNASYSGIGFKETDLISPDKESPFLSGTITVTVNDGVATAVLSDNSYGNGTRSVVLSQNVANGTEQMQVLYNATIFRQLTISNFTAEI